MKFSIITINFNNKKGLEYTTESIKKQTFVDYEWIVVDGGSTDGSLEFIQRKVEESDVWISEPDDGVYNAMNKGIKLASGEYTIFMNAGDRFHSSSVLEDCSHITEDLAAGATDCVLFSDKESPLFVKRLNVPLQMTAKHIIAYGINHQSVFIRTALLKKRLYDESLKFVSDYKFFLQVLIEDNCSYQSLPVIVSDYDFSGMTSIQENQVRQDEERVKVLHELLYPRIYADYKLWIDGTTKLQKVLNEIGEQSMAYRVLTYVAVCIRNMQKCFAFFKFKILKSNA